MRLKEKLNNYLYDLEYKIIIKENQINIINYDEIISFSLTKISVKYHHKLITVEGYNLAIKKMYDNELLITGEISLISIN